MLLRVVVVSFSFLYLTLQHRARFTLFIFPWCLSLYILSLFPLSFLLNPSQILARTATAPGILARFAPPGSVLAAFAEYQREVAVMRARRNTSADSDSMTNGSGQPNTRHQSSSSSSGSSDHSNGNDGNAGSGSGGGMVYGGARESRDEEILVGAWYETEARLKREFSAQAADAFDEALNVTPASASASSSSISSSKHSSSSQSSSPSLLSAPAPPSVTASMHKDADDAKGRGRGSDRAEAAADPTADEFKSFGEQMEMKIQVRVSESESAWLIDAANMGWFCHLTCVGI